MVLAYEADEYTRIADRVVDMLMNGFRGGQSSWNSTQRELGCSSATSALPDQAHRDRVRRTLTRLTERMASVVVDGMMDGSIRPLDPSVAAQISIGLINAAAELTRWVPNANPDNGAEIYVRPIFLGILCPASGLSVPV